MRIDRCRNLLVQAFFIAIVWLPLWPAVADESDTMQSVLARMQAGSVTRIPYRETRYLELMSEPWTGSGYFYADPPRILIREQREPEVQLMAVDGESLYFLDPSKDMHFSGRLDEDDAAQLHIASFRALINGDTGYLESRYRLVFVAEASRWNLILENDRGSDTVLKLTVSGAGGSAADKLQLFLADGDHSLFDLSAPEHGEQVEEDANRLLRRIRGE